MLLLRSPRESFSSKELIDSGVVEGMSPSDRKIFEHYCQEYHSEWLVYAGSIRWGRKGWSWGQRSVKLWPLQDFYHNYPEARISPLFKPLCSSLESGRWKLQVAGIVGTGDISWSELPLVIRLTGMRVVRVTFGVCPKVDSEMPTTFLRIHWGHSPEDNEDICLIEERPCFLRQLKAVAKI